MSLIGDALFNKFPKKEVKAVPVQQMQSPQQPPQQQPLAKPQEQQEPMPEFSEKDVLVEIYAIQLEQLKCLNAIYGLLAAASQEGKE